MASPLESLAADVFAASPDHEALYVNESVEHTSAMIVHAVRARRGIVVLTGPAGTGKSTVLRHVAHELQSEACCIFLENPCESFEDVLEVVGAKAGMVSPAEVRTAVRLMRLGEHLLHSLIEDRPLALFIDEAHLLPASVLKQLRLLANLETSREKLLQIVLCGQPSLLAMLHEPELEELRERVSVWTTLEPLRPEETVDYVTVRFAAACVDRGEYFREAELHAIGKAAGGVPRMINALCDHAVVVAQTRQHLPVTAADTAHVIRRITGRRAPVQGLAGAWSSIRRRTGNDVLAAAARRDTSAEVPRRVAWIMVGLAGLLVFAIASLNFADTGAFRRAWGRYVALQPDGDSKLTRDGNEAAAPMVSEPTVLAGLDPRGGSRPPAVTVKRTPAKSASQSAETEAHAEAPPEQAPTAIPGEHELVGPELPAPSPAARATPGPRCGNGRVDDVEECDDGNRIDSDACLNNCREAVCGDGVVRQGAEDCDDGNATNHDACLFGCALARCGDGYLRVGVEACDDGNDIEDDGCSTRCQTWFDLGSIIGEQRGD